MKKLLIIAAIAAAFILAPASAWAVAQQEPAACESPRSTLVIGYGLVVGLNGTGDREQTYFANQTLKSILKDPTVVLPADAKSLEDYNIAAVMVTVELSPCLKTGSKTDVVANSMGDATSLEGGTLLMTPLRGVDYEIYVMAQGPLSMDDGVIYGQSGQEIKILPTVGRIVQGGTVEREAPIRRSGSLQIDQNYENSSKGEI